MPVRLTLVVVMAVIATIWAMAACGQGERAVVQGLSPGSLSETKTSPEGLPAEAGLDYRENESLDEALMELKEMECPEGVEAELWEELKDALEEALLEFGSGGLQATTPLIARPGDRASVRVVSTPPIGDNNWVNDLTLTDHYDATYTLEWHYKNLGDYDQNGTVGISDITPLAIHYGEEVPEEDEDRNNIQAVVDGSNNGIVDIADITPIAMYYGTCCAHYSIRGALSNPESIEDTSEIDTAPIALAEGDGRKTFSVDMSFEPRTYITVAPMDAEDTPGELSNIVLIPNHPPVAQLLAEPTEGDAPLLVAFDASGSSDIDGPIVSYEWDWEGDGVYDHDSGSVAEVEHTYEIAQAYDPRVRVTDEHNGTCTATVAVTAGSWHIFVAVDDTYSYYTDLEVVNEYPAVSYINYVLEELTYVRATDPLGMTWGEPVTVDDADYQWSYSRASLAVVNGYPAIAHYSEDRELKYTRANDTNGDSWGSPFVLADVRTGVGDDHDLSLAVIDDRPAITYNGREPEGVVYLRALDADGDSWGSPIQVSLLYVQHTCSMAVVNGRPAISYWDRMDGYCLKYVRATDAEGNTWGSPIALECMSAEKSSLAAVNGSPAISYTGYLGDTAVLKYVRALDSNGNVWGAPLIVESEPEVGYWPTLVTIHGRPAISYAASSGDTCVLKYVQAADPDGTIWHSPMTVQLPESDQDGATYMSMANVNGHPGISYYFTDIAQGITQLRYAVYY